jgi:HSP20 family protein
VFERNSLKINAKMGDAKTWHRACNGLARLKKTTQTQINIPMKLIRSNPALNLGRAADFGPWLRHPFAGIPAVAQLLEDFFPAATTSPSAGRLVTDLHEDANNFYARFELPGVKKDAVKVELREGVLTISAERRVKSGETDSAYTLSRSLSLPETVNAEGISAKLEDGLLTVTLPKQEQRKPKLIAIN